jgi:Flp pilus assembly protein TadD
MRRLIPLLVSLLAACATSGGARGLRDTSPYEFHRAVAGTMLRTGQARPAIAHLRRMQALRPGAAEPLHLLGRAYLALGAPGAARGALERAVALEPGLAPAHSALGIARDQEGEHRAAEAAHRRAVELAPREAAYHNNLGFCLYLQGRFREAASVLERAVALDGGSRRLHLNAGFAQGRAGDLGRAEAHFRVAGAPGEADNNLGFVLESRGELREAERRYRAALEAAPSLAEARVNLARVSGRLREGGSP